jgi:hypothetical protein
MDEWQQFVVRAVDERGDPITDYHIELVSKSGKKTIPVDEFELDVHAYGSDPSYRCFHVNLTDLRPSQLQNLWVRIIASSGSALVGYYGEGGQKIDLAANHYDPDGKWDAEIEISEALRDRKVSLFYPFTTTLVQITLNREPLPPTGRNQVCWFPEIATG